MPPQKNYKVLEGRKYACHMLVNYLHNHSSQCLAQLPRTQGVYSSISIMSTELDNSIFKTVFSSQHFCLYRQIKIEVLK